MLECERPFKDSRFEKAEERFPEDRYIFKGPGVYLPLIEERVVERIYQYVIRQDEALHIMALDSFTDAKGVKRTAGEMWLYAEVGSFIPSIKEKVLKSVKAYTLTETKALHI